MSLVGCDLEYAVKNTNGEYIPAGLLPITGTKGHPEMFDTGGVEIDCCAVELTMPPASNKDEFSNNILNHYRAMQEKYRSYGELLTTSSVFFDVEVLKRTKFANKMGCDPDFNVWTRDQNPPPVTNGLGLRTFGGHVHIEDGTPATIKACDLTLGMWSVLVDKDRQRKRLYGKAGAFRFKTYGKKKGVEYRVLSNFWCGDKELIDQVWDLTDFAKKLTSEVDSLVDGCGGPDEIQDIINKSKVIKAKAILKSLGLEV